MISLKSWLGKLVSPARSREGRIPKKRIPLPPESALAAIRRPAWIPQTEAGDGAISDSKFSGIAALPAGTRWPECENCKLPLQLFLQLNPDQFPAGFECPWGTGLFQLFYCTNADAQCEIKCNAWSPFAKSVMLRVIQTDSYISPSNLPKDVFPAKRITGWRRLDDFPNWEEKVGELTEPERDAIAENGFPLPADKLGGWPNWIQSVEYPACPECNGLMKLLFQIDSEVNVPYMFGDAGCGHITYCPAHPMRFAFGWACC